MIKRSQNLYKYFVQNLNVKTPGKNPLDVFLRHIAKNYHSKTLQSVEDKVSEMQIQNNYD